MAYHNDNEQWTLIDIKIGDSLHYFSEHKITCSECSYTHTANRAWLRDDAWPGNLGTTLAEAKQKAINCNQYS